MLDSSQHWNLFGYDLTRAVHYVRSGWNEFLWGDASPVLPALDEVVLAHMPDVGERFYHAGRPVPAPASRTGLAEAIVLPDALVLARRLRFPTAVEADLDAALALEVGASSPFPDSDTCSGWVLLSRDEAELELLLVVSSRSAVMAHIAAQLDTHDADACEVWAEAEGRVVLLGGFGEARRRGANRRRLARMLATGAYCLLVLVALFAIAAGSKYLELQQVREAQAAIERSSGDALAMRETLANSRAMIAEARDYLQRHPSVHRELERLTDILGDETWLTLVEVRGETIRIEGQSEDASAVLQQLLEHEAYDRVEAPVAFKIQRSGHERFVIDLTLASGGGEA